MRRRPDQPAWAVSRARTISALLRTYGFVLNTSIKLVCAVTAFEKYPAVATGVFEKLVVGFMPIRLTPKGTTRSGYRFGAAE